MGDADAGGVDSEIKEYQEYRQEYVMDDLLSCMFYS